MATCSCVRCAPIATRAWQPHLRLRSPHTREQKIGSERYEFQMLYGLRSRRWDELVAAGHRMRIYVPYGTHWFPYFYRRLREKKENVFFVLKNLFGG